MRMIGHLSARMIGGRPPVELDLDAGLRRGGGDRHRARDQRRAAAPRPLRRRAAPGEPARRHLRPHQRRPPRARARPRALRRAERRARLGRRASGSRTPGPPSGSKLGRAQRETIGDAQPHVRTRDHDRRIARRRRPLRPPDPRHRRLGGSGRRDGARARRARGSRDHAGARPRQGRARRGGRARSGALGRDGRAVRARARVTRERPRLRRPAGRRRRAAARLDRERGRDGVPAGKDARRLRDAVRHEPPRPLRVREPARAAPAARRAEPDRGALVGGPPLLRRGPRGSRLRAHALRSVGRLRPREDRERSVRSRARPAPAGARRARRRGPPGRHPHRARHATWTSRRWQRS